MDALLIAALQRVDEACRKIEKSESSNGRKFNIAKAILACDALRAVLKAL